MYHTIQFFRDLPLDLEISPKDRLERTLIRSGTILSVQLRPYVIDTGEGHVEVADLFFSDGSAVRSVRFADFAFVD